MPRKVRQNNAETHPAVSLGETLRDRRQECGWSLEELAQRTRIRRDYLEALEEGNYNLLPADVHTRGFLRTYALALGIPDQEVLAMYQRERGQPEIVSIAAVSRPPRRHSCIVPSLGFFLIATVLTLGIGSVIYFGLLNPITVAPTPTPAPPTPTDLVPTRQPTAFLVVQTPGTTATLAPNQTPQAPPMTPGQGLQAVFKVTADCWIRVTADGIQVFEGTLPAGTTRTFTANKDLSARMGNAGGVQVTLNGQDLGVQGKEGEIVNKTWTAP